jgi:hypothetical protein
MDKMYEKVYSCATPTIKTIPMTNIQNVQKKNCRHKGSNPSQSRGSTVASWLFKAKRRQHYDKHS